MPGHVIVRAATFCVIVVCLVDVAAQKKSKPWKQPRSYMKKELASLKEEMAAMQAAMKSLAAGNNEGGQCDQGNVRFIFQSGDDNDPQDVNNDATNVNVNLHLRPDFRPAQMPAFPGFGPTFNSNPPDNARIASCVFDKGAAIIHQDAGEQFAKIMFNFRRIDEDSLKVHVHENGDLQGGCSGLGGHYDPIDDEKDVGDIGVIQGDGENIVQWFNDTQLTLNGPHSIIGRSMIVHDDEGNAVSCCVIGRGAGDQSNDDDNNNHHGHSFYSHFQNSAHFGPGSYESRARDSFGSRSRSRDRYFHGSHHYDSRFDFGHPYGRHFHGSRGFDSRFFGSRGFDRRFHYGRGFDSRFFGSRGFDSRFHGSRGYDSRFHGSRGYDSRFHGSRAFDSRYRGSGPYNSRGGSGSRPEGSGSGGVIPPISHFGRASQGK